MEGKAKNYFFKSFLTIIIAIGIFWGLKQVLPARLFPENTAPIPGIVIDSLALDAMTNDSVSMAEADSLENDTLINRIDIDASDNSEGIGNLINFYEKLYELENSGKGKVRIAYFGDSMNDGDLIVQDIRSAYQSQYGGKGVGFVGITSLSASARYSVTHQYSKNWETQSFLNVKKPKRAFGVDGQVSFVPRGSQTWLRYVANDVINSTLLYNPTLFYGSSSNHNGSVNIALGKDSSIRHDLITDRLLNTLKLSSTTKMLKATFEKADSIPFYGVNFDDGVGVHVDNFSLRGNSGLPLSLFNTDLMNALDKILNYDLIVLQYGTNVLGYGTTDYSWYETKMAGVVNHLQQCFPNASILIISTGDRAIKTDMEMKTDKAVEPLVKHQRLYAESTHSGFINLYTLMGGYGSMIKWVQENPSLANKDYTHFNQKGAKKIGGLIYDELDKGYFQYKKLKESGQIPNRIKHSDDL
ncbi:lysophospholipase L1-like esterase [Dysgonomonas alginatilytica]|uniref:Lysophospholipase L1-like esterase n=1 Tax=Dysgonomonas alginatilytica TaxID=1605892 RepID=A0A2V3PQI3_9BACT|nr:hypothetical protein [Dysgonomonas alginatilytica]PXV64069.1 lysophospholipase L1-like esterase [Dysgonomonas alginatilytica]